MTIEELKEIIEIMDYDGICAEIEKRGFRRAGEDGVWEFELSSLWNKSSYIKGITKEDKKTDKYFRIKLYKDCTDYEGLTFVSVCFSKIEKFKRRRVPIPKKTMIFTDAPINEEYLRDINSIVECDLCGKEYVKKQLLDYENKRLCCGCFCFKMDKQFTQEIVDGIREIQEKKD